MENRVSILFYGKKTKQDSSKVLSIYLRVTIDGRRFEVSTQRYIESIRWSSATGKVKGISEDARSINYNLDIIKQKVYEHQRDILAEGKPFNKDTLHNKWFSRREHTQSLVEVFRLHNHQLEALIGKDCSRATFTKYRTTLDHTTAFIRWKYQSPDVTLSSLSYSFITDFEFWLKTVRNCNHNTTIKYLSNLRKIINECIKNGGLQKDPFFGFKMSKREVVREFLTEEELNTLLSKNISNTRLRQVRDIFIFSCYTGLAYIDAKRLKRSQIIVGIDGDRWIDTQRKKTDAPTRIPLLPVVLEIMEVYKEHPACENQDSLLPVPSNAKLNAYLKELGDICGIEKNLTFHMARHTFATTITLNNGVPIETVSKMLGHKSIKITQIYAKILDRKVSEDMKALKQRLLVANEANGKWLS